MDLLQRLRKRWWATRFRWAVRARRFGAFGPGAVVHPPLSVDRPERVHLGDHVFVLANATLAVGPQGTLRIGSRTYLGRDLTIVCQSEVTIGDDVMGSDRLLFADTGPAALEPGVPVARQPAAPPRPVRVERGVFLGTGAMILAGVTVGEGALVGAGAVVTRDVPPRSVVVGNPARVVRHYDTARGEWVDGPPGVS